MFHFNRTYVDFYYVPLLVELELEDKVDESLSSEPEFLEHSGFLCFL